MTVTFTLPATFDPAEFLTGRLLLQADAARWFVSTVLRKTADNKDIDPRDYVRLDSMILSRVMGNQASRIVRALAEGAIETAPHYPGVKCRGYRLARRYLSDRAVRVRAVDPWFLARREKEQQRLDAEESQPRWKAIHFALDAEQQRLTIDRTAHAIVDALPDDARLCQDVLVDRLRRREYPFTVSTTGRVFNAITGLKRELRAALRIGGEPLGSVDIACAQPALLALEMGLNSPTNELKGCERYRDSSVGAPAPPAPLSPALSLPAAPAAFAPLVFSGRLYEYLMALTGMDRDAVKLAFLRDVLAKKRRPDYPSEVERAFRMAFPAVYAFIRQVNRRDHAELIRRLQRRESWLVVEQVAPRLVGRVPVVTLHDAIYSTVRSLGTVEAAFIEAFDELGCRLALKSETNGPDADTPRQKRRYGRA